MLTYVKLIKTDEDMSAAGKPIDGEDDRTLLVKGFSEQGEVLFTYNHKSQGIQQTFGVNLKKYNAMQQTERAIERENVEKEDLTDLENTNEDYSDGAYVFRP